MHSLSIILTVVYTVQTLGTYRNSDPGHFGISALDSLSAYMEDQSHCILCDSFLPLVTLGISVGQFEFEYYAKAYP